MSDFALQPSPPDPQPVRVWKLDDYDWWAGYSLESVIAAARAECGQECYEDAETDAMEMDDADMQRYTFNDPDSEPGKQKLTFAAELQRRIDAGEQFPQFFASTEY
jgi:hypothetical protein